MRKTARLKLEYLSLLEENKSIHQMLGWCDSVRTTHMNVVIQLDDILSIKEEKIRNLQAQYNLAEGKYDLANTQLKKEKRKKGFFIGTTITAGIIIVAILAKNSIP